MLEQTMPVTRDAKTMFDGKRILVTGGTGSLGKVLVARLLSGRYGRPESVTVFSRDEAKHYDMRILFSRLTAASEDVIYSDHERILRFRIGDVRDFGAVQQVLKHTDIVFNAAALKQVPNCEYFPAEAIATNVGGPLNITRAIATDHLPVESVIGISTDKACHPVNVMGMTKALQERIFISANMDAHDTRLICARYGNVLASRGSVIPLFHSQIKLGGPVTITTREMTRYFLSLEQAVDTVIDAYRLGQPGDIFIPRVPSSRIELLAECLIGDRPIEIKEIGIRPGEKIHEILVAEDEAERTVECENYYVIRPSLPELQDRLPSKPALSTEYSSRSDVMSRDQLMAMLIANRLRVEDAPDFNALFGSTIGVIQPSASKAVAVGA
jgi:FlaA1/EpsC-like NDP-sugar epimerase